MERQIERYEEETIKLNPFFEFLDKKLSTINFYLNFYLGQKILNP